MLGAWRNPRLWITLLWSLALGGGLAAWDSGERRIATEAAAQRIVMVAQRELNDLQRADIVRKLGGESGIAGARWLPEAELERRLARLAENPGWRETIPAGTESFPAMLEIRPTRPLASDSGDAFAARHANDEGWLLLWDPEPLRRLARERLALRCALGMFMALAAIAGGATLMLLARPKEGNAGLAVLSAALGAFAAAAGPAAGFLAGGDVDPGTIAAAGAAGFILAGAVAPMLRQRIAEPRLNLAVGEGSDER